MSRKTLPLATKLSDDDEIVYIGVVDETQTMVMRTVKEVFLRISCDTIPEKKKAAVGVRGMRLERNDELKNVYILYDDDSVEVEVKGKQIAFNGLHIANRDTKGVKKSVWKYPHLLL